MQRLALTCQMAYAALASANSYAKETRIAQARQTHYVTSPQAHAIMQAHVQQAALTQKKQTARTMARMSAATETQYPWAQVLGQATYAIPRHALTQIPAQLTRARTH